MIRPSVPGDAPAMVGMAQRFHAACIPDLPFSQMHAARAFHGALVSPSSHCLTLDVDGPKGALVLEAVAFPLGPGVVVREVIFWIDEGFRGHWWRQMLRAGEVWAKSTGATHIGLSCFNDGRTVKLFERAGYTAREIVASKRV